MSDTRIPLCLAALAACWTLGLEVSGVEEALLYLLPALLLLVPLLLGRYPGERVLARVAARRRAPLRRPEPAAAKPPTPRRRVTRGGLLIASAQAGRGPPLRPA